MIIVCDTFDALFLRQMMKYISAFVVCLYLREDWFHFGGICYVFLLEALIIYPLSNGCCYISE